MSHPLIIIFLDAVSECTCKVVNWVGQLTIRSVLEGRGKVCHLGSYLKIFFNFYACARRSKIKDMYAIWRKVCALLCNSYLRNMILKLIWFRLYLLYFGVVNRILSFFLPNKAFPFSSDCWWKWVLRCWLRIRWEKQAHVLLTLIRTKFTNRTTKGKMLSFGSEIYWKLLKMSARISACSLPIKPESKSNAPENCCLNSSHSYLVFETSNNRKPALWTCINFISETILSLDFLSHCYMTHFSGSTTLCKSQLVTITCC